MMESAELFGLFNAYHVGDYATVIREAQQLPLLNEPAGDELLKNILQARAASAAENASAATLIADLVRADPSPALKSIQLMHQALNGQMKAKAAQAEMKVLLTQAQTQSPSLAPIHAYAIVLSFVTLSLNEGSYQEAYQLLHSITSPQLFYLECQAIVVQICVSLKRIDLAKNVLAAMKRVSDDAAPTMLSEAFVNLFLGGGKIQDALYILQELMDAHGRTALLCHLQAICYIQMGQMEEGKKCLSEAHHLAPQNQDILANLIVMAERTNALEDARQYLAALGQASSKHPFLLELQSKSDAFDRCAQQYHASR